MDQELLVTVLQELAAALAAGPPVQEALDHFVRRATDVLSVSGAGVVLLGPDLDLHFVAASNDTVLQIEALQLELGEGPCLTSFRTGEAVLMADPASDLAHPLFGPRAAAAGLLGVYTFPLVAGTTRLGALDVYRDTRTPLSPGEIRAGCILADVVSAYLASARARQVAESALMQARHRMLHDDLTGLANRTLFQDRLEHAVAKTRRSHGHGGVLFVDLDRFKSINDRYGHMFGDQVLRLVADRLSACVRAEDTVARFAGDEFVILCEDLTGPPEAEDVAHRIKASLSQPGLVHGRDVDITASIGVVTFDGATDAASDMLRHADAAMFEAKGSGGNRHQVGTKRGRDRTRHADTLERDLPDAIAGNRLRLVYQPIVAATDGKRHGLEALLRWNHPHLGEVSPLDVVSAADRLGLTSQLGAWVARRACQDEQDWRQRGYVVPQLSINVAPYELTAPTYAIELAAITSETGTDPQRLCLEITETSLLSDAALARRVLTATRALGIQIALDDFGTGYSSLAHLRHLPIDIIKVDRSFVRDLDAGTPDHRIVSGLTALAHALDLQVTAEGIETPTQLRMITRIGCDAAQGFHIGRPMERDLVPT